MKKKISLDSILSINGIGIVIVYIALFVILGIACPRFFTVGNIMISIRQAVFIAICGFAMTFVISMGGIDLSVGSVAGFSAMLVATLITSGMNVPLAIVITIAAGALIGIINGLLVTKLHIAYFIATLGTSEMLRGLIYVRTKGVPIYGVRDPIMSVIGQGYVGFMPVPILITAVIFLICYYLFYRTKLGRYAVSIGSNEEAAHLVGIHVRYTFKTS